MKEDLKNIAGFKRHFLKHRRFFLLLTFLCFAAYINSIDNAFVSDDIYAIVQNPELGNLLLALKRLDFYELLKSLIFLCFGGSVYAYHSVNILMHILASILVYFFLAIVTSNRRVSVFSTLLFALHPIHTEAVSWISGSAYVLYSIFFLLSFLFFHFYLENQGRILYLVSSLIFYSLALASSIWVIPLSAVFFLYEKYLREKKVNWVFYLVLVLLSGLYLFFQRSNVIVRVSSLAEGAGTAFRGPTITIPHSLTQYLYLLVWPIKLTLYHEGEILTPTYLFWARILSLAFLIFLPLIFRKKRLFIFFWLFFLISIALSLSPLQIAWYVAERYLYLGSISFCVLVSYLLIRLEKKTNLRGLAVSLLVPILAFYFIRTVIRNNDWQSHASIWFATAQVSPRSPKVHNNLGDVYGSWGDLESAIREFELARELQPRYADATHNLGNTYLQKGDLKNAKKYFFEAIEYNPLLYQSWYSLGAISDHEGNQDEAKRYFEKALRINPNYEPAKKALEILEQGVNKQETNE